MKKFHLVFSLFIIFSCNKTDHLQSKTNLNEVSPRVENQTLIKINENKNTLKERFSAPDGYSWVDEKPDSFGYYLENFPLKKYGSPILKYDGTEIATQNLHEAIFDIDTGNKDLQQCADALIRLRAEYLFKTKKFDEIKFHFTSGDLMTWNA